MNKLLTAIMAIGVLLLANAFANAGDIKVSNVKVEGDPKSGHVDVEFDVAYMAQGSGSIVFLAVQAGQDKLEPISRGGHVGDFHGHFKGKLPTGKSVASLTDTRGNKPIPIMVYLCEVYDQHQADVWISNHAYGIARNISTLYLP